ncbi:MAG: hypothetical protein GAK35_01629 [Herbaspirillum frisingense]|uniref:Uncharacterized protein n=1 Tax=Herbaspirillum frisingense TaxID=92645 RepID=A0A7V8JUT3_9BURK|nr:MAG: hypothetical protein GAK35_01629 [Herbaspirillum frisingense]
MRSPQGQRELLARGSIIKHFSAVGVLGPLATSLASIATPFNPAWIPRAWNGAGHAATASDRWADPNDLRDILDHAGRRRHRECRRDDPHDDPTDISTLAASGGIFYAGYHKPVQARQLPGLQIAGPGTLHITAGNSVYQASVASIGSIGPLVSGDTRPGASVVVQAGMDPRVPGVGHVDPADFAQRYSEPANPAGAGPLADQPGTVVKTYEVELVNSWHNASATPALQRWLASTRCRVRSRGASCASCITRNCCRVGANTTTRSAPATAAICASARRPPRCSRPPADQACIRGDFGGPGIYESFMTNRSQRRRASSRNLCAA